MDMAFLLSYGALWIFVGVETLVLLGLVHAVHRLAQEGPSGGATSPDERTAMVGKQLPEFQVVAQKGLRLNSTDFRGRRIVLLFVSPSCRGCARVLDDLTPFNQRGEVIVLCRGDGAECEQLTARHSLKVPVGLDVESKVSGLLRVNGVPTAVVIDPEGRIRSYGYPEFGADTEALAPAESASDPSHAKL